VHSFLPPITRWKFSTESHPFIPTLGHNQTHKDPIDVIINKDMSDRFRWGLTLFLNKLLTTASHPRQFHVDTYRDSFTWTLTETVSHGHLPRQFHMDTYRDSRLCQLKRLLQDLATCNNSNRNVTHGIDRQISLNFINDHFKSLSSNSQLLISFIIQYYTVVYITEITIWYHFRVLINCHLN